MSNELTIEYLRVIVLELTRLSNKLHKDAVSDVGRAIVFDETERMLDYIKARIEELS